MMQEYGNFKLRRRDQLNAFNKSHDSYFVVYEAEKKGYRIRKIQYSSFGLTKNVEDSQKIRIALVPFLREKLETFFKINKEDGRFNIDGALSSASETALLKRFVASLRYAVSQNPDIIIFPEMSLCNKAATKLTNVILSMKIQREMLIVAGTWWHDHRNTLFLFDQTGEKILEQEKYGTFRLKQRDEGTTEGNLEDLIVDRSIGKVITFLDVQGIGRLAFPICKDMLYEEELNIIRQMNVDLAIVPVCSPSDDVWHRAGELASAYHTTSVFCNLCCMRKDEKSEIGCCFRPTTTPPRKRGFQEVPIFPSEGHCCQNALNFCQCTVFDLDFTQKMPEPKKMFILPIDYADFMIYPDFCSLGRRFDSIHYNSQYNTTKPTIGFSAKRSGEADFSY